MMSAKSSFFKSRIEIDRFILYLEKLNYFYQILHLPEKSDGIKQLSESLSSSYIDLAIIGQFKAGKSSFVNSILNDSILPTGIVPVTSVITRIQYGDHHTIVVKYLDGNSQNIPVDGLFEYCSENFNPGNIKHIDVIDVFHPSLKDYKNLRIVDTPGLGSISEENTETTIRWLKKAGYALLVIGSERPLALVDLILIDQVKTICPRIFILMSKLDLIKYENQAELFQYVRDKIKNHLSDDNLPVLGYSVISNSEKYRNIILQEVLKPVQDHNEDVVNDIARHKTINNLKDCIDYTQIVLQNFKKFRNEEKQVLNILDEINKNKDHYRKELIYSTTALKSEVRDWLEKIFLPYKESFFQTLVFLFDHDFRVQKGMLYRVTHWFEVWLKEHLKDELQKADQQNLTSINDFLSEKAGFYSLFLKSFEQSYKKFIKELYEIDITGSPVKVSPVPLQPPDISINRIFESQLDLFFFFLPVSLIKPWIRKYYIKQITYEVDKNIHRHISILTERMLIILDGYFKYSSKTIQNDLKVLEILIDSKVEMERPYQDMLNELNEMKNQLNQN